MNASSGYFADKSGIFTESLAIRYWPTFPLISPLFWGVIFPMHGDFPGLSFAACPARPIYFVA